MEEKTLEKKLKEQKEKEKREYAKWLKKLNGFYRCKLTPMTNILIEHTKEF